MSKLSILTLLVALSATPAMAQNRIWKQQRQSEVTVHFKNTLPYEAEVRLVSRDFQRKGMAKRLEANGGTLEVTVPPNWGLEVRCWSKGNLGLWRLKEGDRYELVESSLGLHLKQVRQKKDVVPQPKPVELSEKRKLELALGVHLKDLGYRQYRVVSVNHNAAAREIRLAMGDTIYRYQTGAVRDNWGNETSKLIITELAFRSSNGVGAVLDLRNSNWKLKWN